MKKAIISAVIGGGLCVVGGWLMIGHLATAVLVAAGVFGHCYFCKGSCKK